MKKCRVCNSKPCSNPSICKKYRIFNTLIKYFGFNDNFLHTPKVHEEFTRIKQMLEQDYYVNQLSLVDIAKKYNYYDCRNLGKVFDSLNINRRTTSEALQNAYLNGKSFGKTTTYTQGWHITWNNKRVYLRSSYEFNYAKYLDNQKINYEVETLRIIYFDSFLKKQRIAIPDFYIPGENLIVEIKSSYFYKLQKNISDKIKAYKENGYNIKIILDNKF